MCLNSCKSGLGAGVSGKTERVDSGPEGNSAGIDSAAIALAMPDARRARVDAFAKDPQELIATQRHHLAVNQSCLALAKFAEAEKYAPWWWRA